eukprot:6201708-Pleurochrysis_carterae.AAC.1
MCGRVARRIVQIQLYVNRALARDKPICCFGRAHILKAPWRTKWRRPTRTASTNPVRPPIAHVLIDTAFCGIFAIVSCVGKPG